MLSHSLTTSPTQSLLARTQAGAACAESAPPAAVDAGADVAAGGGSAAALANAPTWPASEAAGTADAEATADDLEPMGAQPMPHAYLTRIIPQICAL